MTLAVNELQKAVFVRLEAQLSAEVYDHVPQNAAFPYVMIGDDTAVDWSTKNNDGQEITLTIHAWTKSAGRKDVKTLLGLIHTALHQQESNLSLTGFSVTSIRFDFAQTFVETASEGESDHYYHGVIRFRALVENA